MRGAWSEGGHDERRTPEDGACQREPRALIGRRVLADDCAVGRRIVGGRGRGRSASQAVQPERLGVYEPSATKADGCFGRRRSEETAGRVKPATAGAPGRFRRLTCKSSRDDPNDPLFLHDGLDDGVSGTSRITEHATIRIERPLPPNVRIAEDPSATSVVLLRGIPATLNTPALDPALMYDLRASTLEDQALGAIHDHAQNTVEPTQEQLALIAEFQRTDKPVLLVRCPGRLCGRGPPPVLPEGKTASQKRGRLMFVEAEFKPGSTKGICALCHSGPMLNQTSRFQPWRAARCPYRQHRRQ